MTQVSLEPRPFNPGHHLATAGDSWWTVCPPPRGHQGGLINWWVRLAAGPAPAHLAGVDLFKARDLAEVTARLGGAPARPPAAPWFTGQGGRA